MKTIGELKPWLETNTPNSWNDFVVWFYKTEYYPLKDNMTISYLYTVLFNFYAKEVRVLVIFDGVDTLEAEMNFQIQDLRKDLCFEDSISVIDLPLNLIKYYFNYLETNVVQDNEIFC